MKLGKQILISGLVALALAAQAAAAAQLADKKALTLEVIKQIVAAAEKEAANNKWNMFIAIVDDGGNLVYLERMDDAQLGSGEVAPQKARSALMFKRPTKAFEDALVGGRQAILKLPGALPIEGGIPLMADGKIIGAIGVSGGTSQQDGGVGQAGVNALASILSSK